MPFYNESFVILICMEKIFAGKIRNAYFIFYMKLRIKYCNHRVLFFVVAGIKFHAPTMSFMRRNSNFRSGLFNNTEQKLKIGWYLMCESRLSAIRS